MKETHPDGPAETDLSPTPVHAVVSLRAALEIDRLTQTGLFGRTRSETTALLLLEKLRELQTQP